ncbi:hypothetical protein VitviT2T_029084 [Vitis vinifera]|uniref:Pentatricopeptide repeat-containing protein n=1 Tax=Vitis vinifera TaxID=29760 RepID=A0ABY9DV54_VITVI|nr:hypothetical protein VitviT2T_029084 [Vitis vinifera]
MLSLEMQLWTCYAQNGLASEAIEVYKMMEECKEIIPNQGTWVSILPAYAHVGDLQQGNENSEFPCNRYTHYMASFASVDLNLAGREMVILGTQYAGEVKMGLFSGDNGVSNIEDDGVRLDHFGTISTAPTGPAVVMFQSNGQNSIIVVGDGDGFVHASA